MVSLDHLFSQPLCGALGVPAWRPSRTEGLCRCPWGPVPPPGQIFLLMPVWHTHHSRVVAFVLSDDMVPWSTLLFKLLLLESSYLSMRTRTLSSSPLIFSSKTPG